MKKPELKLSVPSIVKTLTQLQGVDHVLAHEIGSGSLSFTVLAWTGGTCVEATITTPQHLDDLVDVIECHIMDVLVDRERSIKFRITS